MHLSILSIERRVQLTSGLSRDLILLVQVLQNLDSAAFRDLVVQVCRYIDRLMEVSLSLTVTSLQR